MVPEKKCLVFELCLLLWLQAFSSWEEDLSPSLTSPLVFSSLTSARSSSIAHWEMLVWGLWFDWPCAHFVFHCVTRLQPQRKGSHWECICPETNMGGMRSASVANTGHMPIKPLNTPLILIIRTGCDVKLNECRVSKQTFLWEVKTFIPSLSCYF